MTNVKLSSDITISMLKPGRPFFIPDDVPVSVLSPTLEPLSAAPAAPIAPAAVEIVAAREEQVSAPASWPGNPPYHVEYLGGPLVLPETILNSRFLVTAFSLSLPSDPILDGREIVVYNNSIQSIIIRANTDSIFEVCPRRTCRLAYLTFVGLWVET